MRCLELESVVLRMVPDQDSQLLIDEFLCLIERLEIREKIRLLEDTNQSIKDKLKNNNDYGFKTPKNKRKHSRKGKSLILSSLYLCIFAEPPVVAEEKVSSWLLNQAKTNDENEDAKKKNNPLIPQKKRKPEGLNLDSLLNSYKEGLNGKDSELPSLLVLSDDEDDEGDKKTVKKDLEENMDDEPTMMDTSGSVKDEKTEKEKNVSKEEMDKDQNVEAAKGLILPLMMVNIST